MANLNNRDPISPKDPRYGKMLQNLQGNILMGHGRGNSAHIFVEFKDLPVAELRSYLAAIAITDKVVTSAWEQDIQRREYKNKKGKASNKTFGNLFLTASGYRKLGFQPDKLPKVTDYFLKGMKNKHSIGELQDLDPKDWEEEYQVDIDAMVLLANGSKTDLKKRVESIVKKLGIFSTPLKLEFGQGKKKQVGQGKKKEEISVDHFGYTDGLSQPIFLQNDSAWPKKATDRNLWNPAAPLNLVLVEDKFANDKDCFGSYLVFRKLAQEAVDFFRGRTALAFALGKKKPDELQEWAERVGAMMVGRFENGTPMALSETSDKPLANNFTYANDPQGLKCPVFAHARIANPRTRAGRERRIARRGVLYDDRPDPRTPGSIKDFPKKLEPAGLLFMCFQQSIDKQFAHIQQQANLGHDPIIRTSPHGVLLDWPIDRGKGSNKTHLLENWVTLRGGEYFFAPSLRFFASLRKP